MPRSTAGQRPAATVAARVSRAVEAGVPPPGNWLTTASWLDLFHPGAGSAGQDAPLHGRPEARRYDGRFELSRDFIVCDFGVPCQTGRGRSEVLRREGVIGGVHLEKVVSF